jgi:hypothetical protein
MKAVERRDWKWGGLVFAGAIAAGATAWALQAAGDPVLFRPTAGRKGQAVTLPRGDVLLFELIQRAADSSGEVFVYKGEDPPDTRVTLSKDVDSADLKGVQAALEAQGFSLSEEVYREKPVRWVQRQIVPPRRKGKISREPEKAPSGAAGPAASRTGGEAPEAILPPSVKLYRSEAGSGARYMVIYETSSREDADDVLLLLRAKRAPAGAARDDPAVGARPGIR